MVNIECTIVCVIANMMKVNLGFCIVLNVIIWEYLGVVGMKYITHFGLHKPGNAGDTVLFVAVRRLFDKLLGPQEWNLMNVHKIVEDCHVKDCNEKAKAIVVGGGGLFLRDTNANKNSGWQWQLPIPQLCDIRVPIILFSIGYNRFRGQDEFEPIFRKHINATGRRLSFFGLRNQGSIRAMKKYIADDVRARKNICYQPCPTVFLDKLFGMRANVTEKRIALNIALDREYMRFGGRQQQILRAISKAMKLAQNQGWKIDLVAHCGNDCWMEDFLDKEKVKYQIVRLDCRPHKFVLDYYSKTMLSVGMRGHAGMMPFGFGNPFISLISHNKLAFFLEDIGHPELGIEVTDNNLCQQLMSKIGYIEKNYKEIKAQIAKEKERLWKITVGNMQNIRRIIGAKM